MLAAPPPRRNLGCANTQCNLCKLCQRRRCPTNFAAKYLAPCDVVEAKCGAQIYVVVTDATTGQLVQQGLEDLALLVSRMARSPAVGVPAPVTATATDRCSLSLFPPSPPPSPQISIIDGRKFESEGDGDDGIERCELLTNKQGQPLLAHGRSGSYTDTKRVMVPMIHGQALLPDLKITDSSEALLTGRAPPFRLAVRAVHRTGEPFHGIAFSLSDPFVVATARVKGAAKLEIPHVDDHVSKIDCVGLQVGTERGFALNGGWEQGAWRWGFVERELGEQPCCPRCCFLPTPNTSSTHSCIFLTLLPGAPHRPRRSWRTSARRRWQQASPTSTCPSTRSSRVRPDAACRPCPDALSGPMCPTQRVKCSLS